MGLLSLTTERIRDENQLNSDTKVNKDYSFKDAFK